MVDPDKGSIRPLGERSDYNLWLIRVVAVIEAKVLEVTLSTTDDIDQDMDEMRQAKNIIYGSLSHQALHIVCTVLGNPTQILEKLDRHYDSKTIASNNARMSDVVSIRCSSLRDNKTKHVYPMTSLTDQLLGMKTNLDHSLAFGILLFLI